MKLEQFKKLSKGTKLYDVDHDEFVTKAYVLMKIKERAIKIARSNYPLSSEKNYIYGWSLDNLVLVNPKKVKRDVDNFLKRRGLSS